MRILERALNTWLVTALLVYMVMLTHPPFVIQAAH